MGFTEPFNFINDMMPPLSVCINKVRKQVEKGTMGARIEKNNNKVQKKKWQ